MTTADLTLRQDVRVKTSDGEIAKGWISLIDHDSDHRGVYTVTFHQDRFNEKTDSGIVGREFYRQALLNAMEAAEAKGG